MDARRAGWLREAPFWAVSAVLHLVLFFFLIQLALTAPNTKEPPRLIRVVAPEAPPQRERSPRRNVSNRLKTFHPEVWDKPIIELEPEVERAIAEGSEAADTNVDVTPWSRADNSLGVGGGGAKRYGDRKGMLVKKGGGGPESEKAVVAALEWLRRHQSSDGSWRAADFVDECRTTCANTDGKRYGNGRGFSEHDVGVTALAMLPFAGYGHTHQDGERPEYVEVLRNAVRFMKSVQVESSNPNENGRYGHPDTPFADLPEQWIYDHAIATMAMGELLAMSNDVIGLRRSVTNAAKPCLHSQNAGYGWKYGIKPGRNDTSVTDWMVLALKTAKNARLDIPQDEYARAFRGALAWLDRATSRATGKTGYEVPGDEGSRLADAYVAPYPYSKDLSCMTAVAVLCRLFAGTSRSDPMVKRGVDVLMRERPAWSEAEGGKESTVNVYYWYYGSYALFQFGGSLWKRWNESMLKALLSTQRTSGDEDGSWDPIGEWGAAGGRVYSTALGAMTLEVYYRYLRTK